MIKDIITSKNLTFEQKVVSLARSAENSITVLDLNPDLIDLKEKGVICDLFEGNAPYRPRYIVPDYEKFMKNGSKFLELLPPTNIWEATNSLLILYRHVPSITTMPTYVGNLDTLLEPFIKDEEEAYLAIKLFLRSIDRTITDSFCHGNIGPVDTKAGRLILRAMREENLTTPNLTLKYSKETSKELAIDSINTAMITAKPSFANDEMFREDFSGEYGIVSCYNGLKVGGGAHTLVRVRLSKVARMSDNLADFVQNKLPFVAKVMLEYMDSRINFLVEESNFFNTNFLAKEDLINIDKFTGLFGVVGLAECVNHFLGEDMYGKEAGNTLGLKIVQELEKIVKNHTGRYVTFSDNHYMLHAQVGIDTDLEDSPGCRIPVGSEPEILEHLIQSAPFHKYFPTGIGDIFVFDDTFKKNPEAILDIIKGGFATGLRFFSLYGSDTDVVRVTGYLVKRSEMAKLERGEAVLRDTEVLGKGARDNGHALDRRKRDFSSK